MFRMVYHMTPAEMRALSFPDFEYHRAYAQLHLDRLYQGGFAG